jgi:hypothetical protein
MTVTQERRAPTQRPTSEQAWMKRLSIAWAMTIAGIVLFEPVPTNADAAEPWWAVAAGITFLATLGAITITAIRRHRAFFPISAFAGGLGMVLAYACLASGHHLGAWWLIELSAFAGLAAMSIAADRSR